MFDSIDYESVVKYIEEELIPYINYKSHTQSGGDDNLDLNNPLSWFYTDPKQIIDNAVLTVGHLTCITMGKDITWFSTNVEPIIKKIESIVARVWGYNNSKVLSRIISLRVTIKTFLYFSDYIVSGYKKLGSLIDEINDTFEIPEEKIEEIKELLNSVLKFLNILSLVIMSINVITPNTVPYIEKRVELEFVKVKKTTKKCYQILKRSIMELFVGKTPKNIYGILVGDQSGSKNNVLEEKKIYVIAFMEGGSKSNLPTELDQDMLTQSDQKEISQSVNIIKQYFEGTSFAKLISNLYSSFNFPSISSMSPQIKFYFDKPTGTIKSTIPSNKTIWLGSDNKIKLVMSQWDIKYYWDDGTEINTFGYFNGNPLHSALIYTWYRTKSESVKLTFPSGLPSQKQNNLDLLDLTKPFVDTTCNLFKNFWDGSGSDIKSKCLEMGYAIILNSPEYMLKILSDSQLNFNNLLKSSNKKIHYQILKTLGFKKNSKGQICSYDEWNKPISKYLTPNVKNIINLMVTNY